MNLINTIGKGVLIVGMTVANWFGVVPSDYFVPIEKQIETKVVYEQAPILGASFQGGDVVGLFVTTLASRITNTATSMTLTSATDKDGNTLASSTYGFIIDEGTSVEEFVLADCTGTACTNMTRGVSVYTGTSTVSTLKYAHARGAEVKITDAPALIYATNILRGKQYIEQPILYNSHPTFSKNTEIVDKKYVDDTAFSGAGVIDASSIARGVVELATTLETASSTSSGSSGVLAIPASNATSTYNSATAGLKVVVTQNSGKIDSNFISLTAPFPPIGTIALFATSTAPTGWLSTDGTAVSRSTYSNLFSLIGTSYGVGDNSTTFNLPLFNISGTSNSTISNIIRDSRSTGTAATNSLTFSHTTSGLNRALFVYIVKEGSGGTTGDTVTGVTYGGVAMTQLKKQDFQSIDNTWHYIYGLLSPTIGSNNIVVSASVAGSLTGFSASYNGISQTQTLPDASASAISADTANITTTITIVKNNCLIFAGGGITTGTNAGGTNLFPNTSISGSSNIFDSYNALPAGVTTIGITGTSGHSVIIGVSFCSNGGITMIKY